MVAVYVLVMENLILVSGAPGSAVSKGSHVITIMIRLTVITLQQIHLKSQNETLYILTTPHNDSCSSFFSSIS